MNAKLVEALKIGCSSVKIFNDTEGLIESNRYVTEKC